jgi:DNA-binding Lrp family transcriptional regulator
MDLLEEDAATATNNADADADMLIMRYMVAANGNISISLLSEILKMPPSHVQRKIKKLEDVFSVYRSYKSETMERNQHIQLAIKISANHKRSIDKILNEICSLPFVQDVHESRYGFNSESFVVDIAYSNDSELANIIGELQKLAGINGVVFNELSRNMGTGDCCLSGRDIAIANRNTDVKNRHHVNLIADKSYDRYGYHS